MSVISKLASSLNRRDEVPNQELAKELIIKKNVEAVEELVDHLFNNNTAIQNDCIKVLYEIGAIAPNMIAGYANTFVQLLDHKNNRMQWGAMTALSAIADTNPKAVYDALPKIIATAHDGTVITRDHVVKILIGLSAIKPFADRAFNELIIQLEQSPPNQIPMYAEKSMTIANLKNKDQLIKIFELRYTDLEKESQKKRLEKVIQKLKKM